MAAISVSSAVLVKATPAVLSSSKNGVNGTTLSMPQQTAFARSVNMVCKAESSEDVGSTSRRAALTLFAGAAAVLVRASPAEAAYGEAANVFGSVRKESGYKSISGNGFKIDVPSKWNPSKELEFPGTVLRFEDNFDATSNLSVVIVPAAKSSITDYGTPEKFLEEVSYLLGKQSYAGSTRSEGGFAANIVSTASVLGAEKVTIDNKDYYRLNVLTRTADGDEGGRHQLITGTVSDGKLYLLKVQAGDKRWFKGAKKFVEGTIDSFLVA